MPRYAALLRGVSPSNASMPALKAAFEAAGFTNVRTVLSSGNVVFDARSSSESAIERRAEAAMKSELGRSFLCIVRSIDSLQKLLKDEPFASFRVDRNAKRVVTFLRSNPRAKPELPVEVDGARILALRGREVFTTYVPHKKGAVFMVLIEKTFGKDVTTRTWDTVAKLSR